MRVGILRLDSTRHYGCNRRGNRFYPFQPFGAIAEERWLVASKAQFRTPCYAAIEELDRDEPDSSSTLGPNTKRGAVWKLFGPVSRASACDEALQWHYKVIVKHCVLGPDMPPPVEPPAGPAVEPPDRIYAIDPSGCEDRDDAFSIGPDYVNVYISDVDHYVRADSAYDKIIRERASSLYSPLTGLVHHMLAVDADETKNDDWLVRRCSLTTDDTWKAVLKVELAAAGLRDQPSLRSISVTQIQMTRTLSYEGAQAILDKPAGQGPRWAREFQTDLKQLADWTGVSEVHELVAILMIATNRVVGQYLADHGYRLNRVCRREPEAAAGVGTEMAEVCAKYLARGPAAYYSTNEIGHAPLGIDYYTHFTSPMRRYPDLLAHRLVKGILAGRPVTLDDGVINSLNEQLRLIKRYYRKATEHALYYDLKSRETELLIMAYPIAYNAEKSQLRLYCPEGTFQTSSRFKEVVLKSTLFGPKLRELIKVTVTADSISLQAEGHEIQIKFYQPLCCRVYAMSGDAESTSWNRLRIRPVYLSR